MKLLILCLLLSGTALGDVAKRMQSELEFLEQASKDVKVNLLDLEKEDLEDIEKNLATNEDSISMGMAAPQREQEEPELMDKKLQINDQPVESVHKLLRRSR